jgi:hypothetical protein
MSDAAGGPPSSTPGDQQGQPPSDGPVGYISPDEQAKRLALAKQADQGMNMNISNQYRRQAQRDAAANAAASGGRFVMDADAMGKFLPKWQAIADKLGLARQLGQQLRGLRPPAQDEGSLLQKKAADAHADAYVTSVTAQQTYAQNYADALKAAIAKTQQQDQNAQDAVNKTGVQR